MILQMERALFINYSVHKVNYFLLANASACSKA